MDVALNAYFAELPDDERPTWVERFSDQVTKNLFRQGVGRYPASKVRADVERGLDHLVAYLLSSPFLAGSNPSLCDFAIFGQVERRLAGTNPWFEQAMEKRPELQRWCRRIDELSG